MKCHPAVVCMEVELQWKIGAKVIYVQKKHWWIQFFSATALKSKADYTAIVSFQFSTTLKKVYLRIMVHLLLWIYGSVLIDKFENG